MSTTLTPEQRADRAAARQGSELKRILNRALPAMLAAPGMSDERKYFRLYELADKVEALILPETPCRKGCAACCHMAVGIGQYEADQIAAATGRVPQVPSPYLNTKVNVRRFSGKPCPFLKDQVCTVYAVRPLACRLHHSLEDDAEPCDTIERPGAIVRSANLTQFDTAAAALMEGAPFGDIREFFP